MKTIRKNAVATPLGIAFYLALQFIVFCFVWVCIENIRDKEYTASALLLLGLVVIFELIVNSIIWRSAVEIHFQNGRYLSKNIFGNTIEARNEVKLSETRYSYLFVSGKWRRTLAKSSFTDKFNGME
jgi:hypothetical protein